MISIIVISKFLNKDLHDTLNSIDWAKNNHQIIVVVPDKFKIYNKVSRQYQIISQEGHGIYSAMNSGLKIALGSHVIFCNAGDSLFIDRAKDLVFPQEGTVGLCNYLYCYLNESVLLTSYARTDASIRSNIHPGFIAPRMRDGNFPLFLSTPKMNNDQYWLNFYKDFDCTPVDALTAHFKWGGVSSNPKLSSIIALLLELEIINTIKSLIRLILNKFSPMFMFKYTSRKFTKLNKKYAKKNKFS